ncbi:DUF4251 domain-containing protein [Cellulophaga sp. L1A9]|uniref:DUF4251 domain-containing protein n=1 Tax=Cellulophaga sp. L1A9 TaxID=2686362 RepID=UPI001E43BD42|nr:DUF4251 domain-containing protein [Cellulophaga sp. L1A9]
MLFRLLFFLFSGCLLLGCSTTNKTIAATPKSKALDKLVVEKKFLIISDRASPMTTSSMNALANSGLLGPGNSPGAINLIGNTNYLRIKGDSIKARLPFFGERQIGGGYNSNDTGISFENIPTAYEHVKNNSTQIHTVKFKISGETNEQYTFTVLLFPNWTTEIRVNSSQRTSIGFRGTVSEIPNEEN